MKSATPTTQAEEPSRANANNIQAGGKAAPAAPPNHTGLPDNLKTGVEQLSGFSLNDVKVHYNSGKPAQLQAFAYAQGSDIHIAPGQEKHLPHEAWHVVQQKQGRVQATLQTKGVAVNDDPGLEKEADAKGAEADKKGAETPTMDATPRETITAPSSTNIVQRALLTKQDVFEDQIKWAVVLGIANIVDAKSGDGNGKTLAELLDTHKIIDQGILVAQYKLKKVQSKFFADNKTTLLNNITLKNLQDSELVMDVVTLVEKTSASWDLYKTDIKDSKDAEGYAGQLRESAVKVKSRIKWDDVANEQGKGVTAHVLAPDHPLGSPPTNKKINQKVKEFSTAAGNPYIAGHLLNNNLGGPGNDEKNLTAIPMDVNSEMSTQVENKVIDRVNKDHEVMYYKVVVDYLTDASLPGITYASQLTIEFGSYKKDVKDFDAATTGDLEEKYTYTIPIHSPTKYKAGKHGYTREIDQSKFVYKDGVGGKHEWDPASSAKSKDPAKLAFKRDDNIILKNTTQIKLEFISFAIYALKINQLKGEIAELKVAAKHDSDAYDALHKKYTALGEEAKKVQILKDHIQNIKLEYEEDRKEMEEKNITLENEVRSMNEEIKKMEGVLEAQENEAQLLRKDLLAYIGKARDRAEPLGFTIGFEDGSNGREPGVKEQAANHRVSLGSKTPFEEGYKKGHEKGVATFKTRAENEELKKGHTAKDEKILRQQEELENQRAEIIRLQELIRSMQQPQQPKVKAEEVPIVSSVLPDPIRSDKKKVQPTFETLVREHCKKDNINEGLKWLNSLIEEKKILKYDYLAILIHLGIMTPDEAYKAYPSTPKRDDLFQKKDETKDVYNTIKELYENQ